MFDYQLDFFKNFRNKSLKNHGLFPNHYLSAPALSWDTMINIKKVQLELISDTQMYLFFAKSMRCRVSYISKRYSKAKNTYLKSYDLKKYIIHLCSNNLYGYAMLSFFQQEDSNGQILKTFMQIKTTPIVPKEVFQKLILNFLLNHVNQIMIILWLQTK